MWQLTGKVWSHSVEVRQAFCGSLSLCVLGPKEVCGPLETGIPSHGRHKASRPEACGHCYATRVCGLLEVKGDWQMLDQCLSFRSLGGLAETGQFRWADVSNLGVPRLPMDALRIDWLHVADQGITPVFLGGLFHMILADKNKRTRTRGPMWRQDASGFGSRFEHITWSSRCCG